MHVYGSIVKYIVRNFYFLLKTFFATYVYFTTAHTHVHDILTWNLPTRAYDNIYEGKKGTQRMYVCWRTCKSDNSITDCGENAINYDRKFFLSKFGSIFSFQSLLFK